MAEFREQDLTWSDERLWPQFHATAVADPQAVALVDCDGKQWTRAKLLVMSEEFADQFQSRGVTRGDRVLAAGRKDAATLAAALAASALQAVFCPHSPKLGRAELDALESRLGHCIRVESAGETRLSIQNAVHARSTDPRDLNLALIGFTSGSTGVPKGVMHSPEALNYATRACAHIAGLQPNDALLGIVPLESAPGFTFTAHFAFSLGHPLVLVDPWDPVEALRLAKDYHCGWAIMVPTHLYTMVEAARLGHWTGGASLRTAAVGGSAMTPQLIADAETVLGLKALRMFGMSECMGHCSTRPGDPLERRQNYDGIPFPGTEEEAFGEDMAALPRGSRGQAGVRGPSLFMGYAEGMGQGQERMTPDGFYLTGDEIVRDEQGFVKVVGRIKDQIIRGGFNIDPAEIEAALLQHPSIAEVAVVAVPEAKLGEQACAVCRLVPGAAAIDLPLVIEHVSALGLTRKKWPEHLVILDEMRVTATGKLDKKAMSQIAVSRLREDAVAPSPPSSPTG